MQASFAFAAPFEHLLVDPVRPGPVQETGPGKADCRSRSGFRTSLPFLLVCCLSGGAVETRSWPAGIDRQSGKTPCTKIVYGWRRRRWARSCTRDSASKTDRPLAPNAVPDVSCGSPPSLACRLLVHGLLPTPGERAVSLLFSAAGPTSSRLPAVPGRGHVPALRFGVFVVSYSPARFATAVPPVPTVPPLGCAFLGGGGPPLAGRPLASTRGPDMQRRPSGRALSVRARASRARASTAISSRNARRCVGPQQVVQIELCRSVDQTGVRTALPRTVQNPSRAPAASNAAAGRSVRVYAVSSPQ
jgi:hypothetical protein